ncbi:MAG: tRNA (guanosine(37)-N1)-methyltransferase TrmD [Alphaproteobacteria bacterium]
MSRWHAHILTIFPELFPGPLGCSILGRGLEEDKWQLTVSNIRDFALDKHQSVDDIGFGGGPGMVMRPDVLDRALKHATEGGQKPDRIIYVSPRGKTLTQNVVKGLAKAEKVVILCGRFEGIDQRVIDAWDIEEISLGDFVLAGGEVAAMTMVEACVRLLPGVVGDAASLEEESFSQDLLEYPQYTRPRDWNGHQVPEVLLSGHHEKIRAWRQSQSEALTQERRPDLWDRYCKGTSKDEED